jgi:hypothetical protein
MLTMPGTYDSAAGAHEAMFASDARDAFGGLASVVMFMSSGTRSEKKNLQQYGWRYSVPLVR